MFARMLFPFVLLALPCVMVARDDDDPIAAADPAKVGEAEAALVEAASQEKAFLKGEQKLIRAAYVKYFETAYGPEIKAGFGEDYDATTAFLVANPDLKETLLTALNPAADNLRKALSLFRDLVKASPEKVKAYPQLAVALCITWDQAKGVYDYRPHQRRTKSELPAEVATTDALANWNLFTQLDGPAKNAATLLPWEFLVHAVNHRTPAAEREWAAKNYAPRRIGIGKSYLDIEYDQIMLRTQSEVCKLNEQPYTLPSIRKHGGVCAMQADFAARVGKSLVVPAEYVWGESNSGGLHAWVMWAEVRMLTKEKIDFVMLSEGRYLGDQYYVGKVTDPRTGKVMTDRDMERRLTVIGAAPQASRQADLLMRAYPLVREKKMLTTAQQAAYLRRVHDLFPADERAWKELAGLYRDGKIKDAQSAYLAAERVVKTFGRFPDFSWLLVEDLLTPLTDKGQRTRIWESVVLAYESLARPDLACEARIRLAELQVDAKDYAKAANGLAGTVRKFPAEGRYVPKMMAKLQDVCKQYKQGTDLLAKFYLEFLPLVPKRRGDEVSKYCVTMHEQAIEFFESNNKPREAALVKQSLAGVTSRSK